MHTRCPHCSTTFSISQQHLEMAEGQVRCGSCDQVFDARDNVVDAKGKLIRKQKQQKSSEYETGDDIFGMITEASIEPEPEPQINKPKVENVDESWASALLAEEGDHEDSAPAPPKIETAVRKKTSSSIVSEPVSAPTKPRQTLPKKSQAQVRKPVPVKAETRQKPQQPEKPATEFSDDFLSLDKENVNNPFRDADHPLHQPQKSQQTANPLKTTKPAKPKSRSEDVIGNENDGLHDQDLLDEIAELNQQNSPPPKTKKTQAKPPTQAKKPSKHSTPPADDDNGILDELEAFISQQDKPANTQKTVNKKLLDKTSSSSLINELEEIADELDHQDPLRAIPTDHNKNQAKASRKSGNKPTTAESRSNASQPEPLFHLNFDPIELKPNPPPQNPKNAVFIYGVPILLASLLLAFQFSFFNMDQFARDPRYRFFYEKACSLLPCTLPTLQNLTQIRGSHLVVRQHPDHTKALIIDMIMTNKASYPQLFPIMQLTFTDSEHAPVRQRQFKPKEYLTGDLAALNAMPPNTPVHISLEVMDPGPKAKGWEVNFLSYLSPVHTD